MKRSALLRHLRRRGCTLKREGAGHSLGSTPLLAPSKPFRVTPKSPTFLRGRSVAALDCPRLGAQAARPNGHCRRRATGTASESYERFTSVAALDEPWVSRPPPFGCLMSSSAIDLRPVIAQGVTITDDALTVDLADGRTISVPLAWYPRLLHGTPTERTNWRFIGQGEGIHWPDLDEDISIDGLLAGRSSGESQSSLQRWLDSRSIDA